MRPCQSRAPINQYEHDQRNNDHHYSRQSEPPNSDAISPTARRSVAPTTWRNVARVVHSTSVWYRSFGKRWKYSAASFLAAVRSWVNFSRTNGSWGIAPSRNGPSEL